MGKSERTDDAHGRQPIAVIGMAGRFPGADHVQIFWEQLAAGKSSVRRYADDELRRFGVPESTSRSPAYVPVGAHLDNIDLFDAALFGMTAAEAEALDPQHRLFLECAWQALESAGYSAANLRGLTGVFTGAAASVYPGTAGNDPASLVALLSQNLSILGPCMSVETCCSSSLAAVHMACQTLAAGACDIALAGGVNVALPPHRGYVCHEEGMWSADGCCRPFDAAADGTVKGDGVGIVVLKRLRDAVADGDQLHAIIRGSAVGGPHTVAQTRADLGTCESSDVIRNALQRADVNAGTIQYIEAEGLGDPATDATEIAALRVAFADIPGGHHINLGSLKPNIGYLERAAGVAGLIKSILALKHQQLPPTLNFREPPAGLGMDTSCFRVSAALTAWPPSAEPRRAVVSSLGLGGSNAHVILEEPPPQAQSDPPRSRHLLVLSARTPQGLQQFTQDIARDLGEQPELNLADVAYTLQAGRQAFAQRRFTVCRDSHEARELLGALKPGRVWTSSVSRSERTVAFLFPGLGGQYVGMGRGLYESEPVFRTEVDRCAELLLEVLGEDIRELLYGAAAVKDETRAEATGEWDLRAMLGRRPVADAEDDPLSRTSRAHSCIFVMEYALAQLLKSWGIQAQAMIGHSLGEYTAACTAGVFPLADGLRLLVERARRIEALPAGAMLGVALSEREVTRFLGNGLDLAAVNSDQAVAVSGSASAIAGLAETLQREQVAFRQLPASRAFHSSMLDPVADELIRLFASIDLQAPSIPLISCATGEWMTPQQVTDPRYWARQMCQTVRFAQGLDRLMRSGGHFLLEVGPGEALSSLAKQHPACTAERIATIQGAMRSVHQSDDDLGFLLNTLGHMWLAGVAPKWEGLAAGQKRARVALAPRPLQRQRYWADVATKPSSVPAPSVSASPTDHVEPVSLHEATANRRPLTDWLYMRCWKENCPPWAAGGQCSFPDQACWLLLTDGALLGRQLQERLTAAGQVVVSAAAGERFQRLADDSYVVGPANRHDFDRLLKNITDRDRRVTKVLHLWSLRSEREAADDRCDDLSATLKQGFFSLLTLLQALGDFGGEPCDVIVVTPQLHDVTGSERGRPLDALILGPCRVVRHEYQAVTCRNVDIEFPQTEMAPVAARLLSEAMSPAADPVVAIRGTHRYVESFEPLRVPARSKRSSPFREGGVYLITGGYGGIGLALGRHLAETAHAKVALVGRSAPPPSGRGVSGKAADTASALRAMEAAGGEVLALTGDVGNRDEMQSVLRQVRECLGEIHGVFHCAGAGPDGLIQLKTPEMCEEVLGPKVTGTLVLDELLRDTAIDFFVLFSSLSSITGGGPGQVDYCAANAFLDAFAVHPAKRPSRCLSVSWDQWQWDAWRESLWGFPEPTRRLITERRRQNGISFEEGFEVLERVLQLGISHAIVATRDVRQIIADVRDLSVSAILDSICADRQSQPHRPRPDLAEPYDAPKTEVERCIAAAWEDLLGVQGIGVQDDFFELGGNSLLGVRLIGQLREQFPDRPLSASAFYEEPTVHALGQLLGENEPTGL